MFSVPGFNEHAHCWFQFLNCGENWNDVKFINVFLLTFHHCLLLWRHVPVIESSSAMKKGQEIGKLFFHAKLYRFNLTQIIVLDNHPCFLYTCWGMISVTNFSICVIWWNLLVIYKLCRFPFHFIMVHQVQKLNAIRQNHVHVYNLANDLEESTIWKYF